MPVVGPIKDTNVAMVYDTDTAGYAGPADMRGPEIGRVSYVQPGGDLVLRINLEFGQPNTKYEVFLVCGPSHSASCGFVTIGVLPTNAVGAGTIGLTVPQAVLQNPPFGPGFRNDHLDFVGSDPRRSGLTAGAINYFVCRRPAGAAAPSAALQVESTPGDPLSASSKKASSRARASKGGKKKR